MKDEISKRFDEETNKILYDLFCQDPSCNYYLENPDNEAKKLSKASESIKDSLNSEIERQRSEFTKEFIKICDDYGLQIEEQATHFKKQQKINNEVLGDKCDEMERLLKEQEKRLRLNVDILNKALDQTGIALRVWGELYYGKRSEEELTKRLVAAICALKDKNL